MDRVLACQLNAPHEAGSWHVEALVAFSEVAPLLCGAAVITVEPSL